MLNTKKVNIYRPILANIDRKETKRYAGLRGSNEFPEKIVEEACTIVMLEKAPQTVWVTYAYDCETGAVGKAGEYMIESTSLRKHLAQAEQVVFMAATVGEGVEKAGSGAFKRGEYSLGLLIDAAATAAVEQAADELEKLLASEFRSQGLVLTTRFSPGYGDWDLSEQGKVALLAQAGAIGITLTDSLMLEPRKSITAIIGLCREDKAPKTLKGCQNCRKLDCEMRRDR